MEYNIEEKKNLVRDVFGYIEKAEDATNSKWYPEFKTEINKKNKKYPKQLPKLNSNDLDQLQGMDLKEITFQTPLEKLLFAIVWKQGDFHKIDSLIKAASDKNDSSDRKTGFVFHQFGKHLSDQGQPIIDQHVLRSFKAFKALDDLKSFELAINYKNVIKNDTGLIKEYIDWFKNQKISSTDIDNLLFVLGKKIKLT